MACGAGTAPTPTGPVSPAEAARAEGDWNGALDVGGNTLRLVVHLRQEAGAWAGTMDSVDQGANGIPLGGIAPGVDGLTFEVPQIRSSFVGTWTAAGELAGTWKQGPVSLPLTLSKGAPPASKVRPQDPVPPFPYSERALDVDSAPGVKLAGTLTLPAGEGRHAAIVLLTGSGPQDRDEALMGHRPFLVLADALARAGVVVYRFDDRGVAKSTGDLSAATTRDFAVDAAAAVEAVATQPEVDPQRVGVLGHSEGGLSAVLAADQAPVAFVVLMAGPGISGRAILESQVEAMSRAAGASEAVAKQNRAIQAKILEVLAKGGSEAELRAAMKEVGIPDDQIAAQAPAMSSPWYRTFVALDPAPALRELKVPVLALIGDKDTQVVASENAPALKAALAGNPAATVTVLPGLNHLFQPAVTGLVDEYARIETTIDPTALAAITSWVAVR